MAQVGEFSQLDRSNNPQYFINFLDIVDRIPQMQQVRNRTYTAMHTGLGSHVLDVGCGLGTAAMEMARLVGERGKVRGVDASEAMISEAQLRAHSQSNVTFQVSDANRLPYDNGLFDATRMERVLLYVNNRERVLAEMIRVTKPGGRVVVADVDFESVATFSRDRLQTRKMTSLIADACVHPASGRELPYLLRSVGLKDISVDLCALPATYEFCLHVSNGALQSAIGQGRVTQEEVDTWLQDLASIQSAGDFFQSWPFTIASGVVA